MARGASRLEFARAGLLVGVLAAIAYVMNRQSSGTIKTWGAQFLLFLPVFAGSVGAFSLLERAYPAVAHKPARGWMLNFQVAMVYGAAGSAATLAGVGIGAWLDRRFGMGWIDWRFAAGRGLGALAAGLLLWNLIFDFFYYWLHRCQHKWSVMWQTHKLHHMDEQLCAVTVSRQHWLEDFIRIPFITIPMAALFKLDQLDPQALGWAGAMVGWVLGSWSVFIHSNIRLHLGRASWLISGPQLHRVHHSRLLEHHDRNFAAYFPVWDVLFGTYYAPARTDFPPTGVDDEREVESLLEACALPFQGWGEMLRERRQRRASLKSLSRF
jgi:sterol desaturase/sphingolipid hydroxylase (fatty acid hydroxylase superfamily)